ncbi:SulP family inorganic anion transporter [Kribbella sp. NPDC054772]
MRHPDSKDTSSPRFPFLTKDIAASLVVFLVALPLCIGVAVASGVPAELGLVTGIVGGLITGLLPGSSLQGLRTGCRADRARVRSVLDKQRPPPLHCTCEEICRCGL